MMKNATAKEHRRKTSCDGFSLKSFVDDDDNDDDAVSSDVDSDSDDDDDDDDDGGGGWESIKAEFFLSYHSENGEIV